MPQNDGPVDILCRYHVKPGKQQEFKDLLARHWHTLNDAGLATDEPARLFRAKDKAGNIAFIEMFSWKTGESAQTAHETPEVMRLWEPMGALCQDMEFWDVQALNK